MTETPTLETRRIPELCERLLNGSLTDEDKSLIGVCLETFLKLIESLEKKKVSIKRLRQMIFGSKTEKNPTVGTRDPQVGKPPRQRGTSTDKEKNKHRGRLGVDDYPGARGVRIDHPLVGPGDPCPQCPSGRLFELEPTRRIRLFGSAPIQAECVQAERLRCSTCQGIFRADMAAAGEEPPAATPAKADPSAKAMICLLKYGAGMPLYRLARLQTDLGVPLPAATQFDWIESHFNAAYPVFGPLYRAAANAPILHSDDTGTRILSLMAENQNGDKKRKGMRTTSIVAVSANHRIHLYFSGRKHAGENLAELLESRDSGLPPPIHMADALSHNFTYQRATLKAKCLVHARRHFYTCFEAYPQQCELILKHIGAVFHNDDLVRQAGLCPTGRLMYHQRHSSPHMSLIRIWCRFALRDHAVEPNSPLGEAIAYTLKHWEGLTLFLRLPGAPLDNSICERSLKRKVLLRKNSYFFKTAFGAMIGDFYLSLIQTCVDNRINPFAYLVALDTHREAVRTAPELWLPWHYASRSRTLVTRTS